MKVAQIGRRLAQKLITEQRTEAAERGLDPEVVEAACIAHDLGHPPFGHIGETELNSLITADSDGFEGNAQSFRVITKLSVRYPDHPGINMTRATLAACLKYPWFKGDGPLENKWSAYKTEQDDFDFARENHSQHTEKTLEAELMDWADDVAYSVHDLEDFHRCNALPWSTVFAEKDRLIMEAAKGIHWHTDREGVAEQAYDRLKNFIYGTYAGLLSEPYEGTKFQREQLRRMTSTMIGAYIKGIRINPDPNAECAVLYEDELRAEIQVLKQITRDYIIKNPTLGAQQYGQSKIIRDLFKIIVDETGGSTSYPDFLPVRLRYLREIAGSSIQRFASDCVASLSESEAVALHSRLTGIAAGSVLDPIVR